MVQVDSEKQYHEPSEQAHLTMETVRSHEQEEVKLNKQTRMSVIVKTAPMTKLAPPGDRNSNYAVCDTRRQSQASGKEATLMSPLVLLLPGIGA